MEKKMKATIVFGIVHSKEKQNGIYYNGLYKV